ncbi:hypothetical protein [Actinomycetospora sp. TBRC 11914]|uniref:hypothetical protein n=1 Tax=Actinomycetospora sp. TBRC 11914 TaxID=2729387 RepID=UPI00145E10DE|nr:hypothetical protein [Actinomycetospora sp. TBRC 11914]NMO92512.1 hypothetical protein [Actinomycetospora sp. TBRC 11914]
MNTTDVSPGTAPVSRRGLLRVGLHLLLSALPLLAISAQVFGLIEMNASAALLVIPLAAVIVGLSIFDPHPEDRVILHGFLWGIVACGLYDVFRLDTVYMLGWWADFIPTMGTWIIGDGASKSAGAWVGYLWRYLGDGGGIGVAFFVGAAFVGLHRRPAKQVVAVAVAFAVFPVWAGLIATVWIAPKGQTMMFKVTPTTLTLSLIGHLIFGLVMGLGFVKTRSAERFWPWAPIALGRSRAAVVGPAPSGLPAVDSRPVLPPAERPGSGRIPVGAGAQQPAPAPTGERPAVVPPPPLPAGHPSGPLPAAPTSGPVLRPDVTGHGHPSGPLPAPVGAGARSGRPAAGYSSGSSTGYSSGSSAASEGPSTGRTRTATPPAGQTLDPETWALWQRQLATTIKGRRTHRWR